MLGRYLAARATEADRLMAEAVLLQRFDRLDALIFIDEGLERSMAVASRWFGEPYRQD
jgi:hypothetical protein